jgi:type II secretory ATPase GspE/PulE/Tfp pilus assembly ATPase PilB-like protein
VRVICLACKRETRAELEWAGGDGEVRVWAGTGCTACRGTGYRGRTGIYELLVLDEELRAEVMRHRGAGELRRLAIARGMRTLGDDGARLVRAGVTTPAEVLRVTQTS